MHQRTSRTHPDPIAPDLPVLERIRARVRGFNSDESGQSIVYLVLMMFLLACFTFMVINSGALLHDKMQAQSAADSAVLSGSTWIARGMNLNSMMNIFMALCMAEAIYMKAVYWTALSGILLQAVIESFWIGVCLTTGNCAPAVEVPFENIALWGVLSDADDSEDFMWDVMESLTQVEANVDVGFASAAALESSRMAMLNGAGFGIMYPPTIPEEEGDLQDLCECVLDGSDGGYKEAEYQTVGTMMSSLLEINGFQYSGDMLNIATTLTSQFFGSEGPLWSELQTPYQAFWADTAPYHFTNVMFVMAVQSRYAVVCGGTWPPPEIPYVIPSAWWCFLCPDNVTSIQNPAAFLTSSFAFLDAGNPNVKPMVLSPSFEEDRNFYGFAYKSPGDIQAKFVPEVFQNTYGDAVGMLTIAQAQIYNPHQGGGMFSPHWRTHLAPVSIQPEIAEDAANYLTSGALASELGGDPVMISGLSSVVQTLTSSGVDELMAH